MTFESFDRRVVRLWRSKLHHLGIDGSVEVHTTTLLLLRFLFGWRVVRAVVMRFSHLKSLKAAFRAAKGGKDLSNTIVVKETLFVFLDALLRVIFMFKFVTLYELAKRVTRAVRVTRAMRGARAGTCFGIM